MEAVSAVAIEVEDLGASGLLEAASEAERWDRRAQRRKLEIAHQWCVLHPATPESGTATWGDAGLPGLGDCDVSLGGDGSPGVAPFVAEELGAAMGVSTQAAMALMADALDLRHRFPRLWAQVETAAVAPWKTRRVAADARSLPSEAARWIDIELAERVDGFGIPTIERLVALAAARHAPEEQAAKERAADSGWHVTLSHPRSGDFAGTSWLEASGDTQDLTAFHDLVCAEARQLGPARGHRRLRDPQGQGPRHHRRPPGQPRVHRRDGGRPSGHSAARPVEALRPRLARGPGQPRTHRCTGDR